MKCVVHRCQLYKPSTSAINSLAYEPVLKKLALSRADGSIYIYDADEKLFLERTLHPTENDQSENVFWCKRRLFSVGVGGYLTEWSFDSRLPLSETKLSPSPIWSWAKNKKEDFLFLGTEDGAILKCKVGESKVTTENPLSRSDKRILSLAVSPNDEILASGSLNEIKIYDLQSQNCVNRITVCKHFNNQSDANKMSSSKHDTLIWCLAITKDLIVASGDSRGVTSFWDWKSGTLICEFQSHKGDVLSIFYDQTKNQIFSSGVDPTIVQFLPLTQNMKNRRAPNNFRPIGQIVGRQNNDYSSSFVEGFRNSKVCSRDVRAIVADGRGWYYFGGVDACLVKVHFDRRAERWKEAGNPHRTLEITRWQCPILDADRVVVAPDGNRIVFRQDSHFDVWKLGQRSDPLEAKFNDVFALKNEPRLLARIKTSDSNRILYSTIDKSGDYLAYSDRKKSSVLKIGKNDYTEEDSKSINIEKLTLLAGFDQLTELPPTDFLCFINDSNGFLSLLLANDEEKSIFVYEISAIFVKLKQKINYPDQEARIRKIIACDDDPSTIAILTSRNDIFVMETSNKKATPLKLPKSSFLVVDLKFVKNRPFLSILYIDGTMVEYDLFKNHFTPWSQQFLCSYARGVEDCDRLALTDFYGFAPIFDGTDKYVLYGPMLLVSLTKKNNYVHEHDLPYHSAYNPTFRWLLHVEKMSNNDLLALQVDIEKFQERLPPKFHFKKFGLE